MKTVLIFAVLCVGTFAQFTCEGQTSILNVHNFLRSKIAKGLYFAKETVKPPASDMLKMKWDPTLAGSAQAYVNRCSTEGAGTAGKNYFLDWFPGNVTNFDRYGGIASASWEKEFQDSEWKGNVFDTYSGIEHATKMAWAKTNLIGCGAKNCGMDVNGLSLVYVICHYSPQGNNIDQNIYTAGPTCSACPSGTTCERDTGLCA